MSRVMAVSPVEFEKQRMSIAVIRVHRDHGFWTSLLGQESSKIQYTLRLTPDSWKTRNCWVLLEYEILEGWLSG